MAILRLKVHYRILLAILMLSHVDVGVGQQSRARISGTVVDPSGSAVPNASVSLRDTGTNVVLTAVSTGEGIYIVPELSPGTYELSVSAPGFKKYNRTGIELNIGDAARVDVQMELGDTNQSVTVTGDLTGIETNESITGQSMGNQAITETPVNGDNFLMLLTLSAGVTPPNNWFFATPWQNGRGNSYSMHGSLQNTNAFVLDGAPLGSEGGASVIPLNEAIAEMKVATPTSDASYGLSGGGVVSLNMKSGTNQFHGVLREFFRNSELNALYTQTKQAAAQNPALGAAPLRWNNFAATVNGPIIKNRLFFSTYYQGWRMKQPQPVILTVPTALERAGDFSKTFNAQGQQVVIYDPLTTQQVGNSFVRDPFPGNVIPANRISPIATKILGYTPLPNLASTAVSNVNNYGGTPNMASYNTNAYYVKADYLWNERHRTSMTNSLSWTSLYAFSTNGIPRPSPAFWGQDPAKRDQKGAFIDHVYTMSPTTVMSVRLAWDYWKESTDLTSQWEFDGSSLGFTNPIGYSPVNRFPLVRFSDGYFNGQLGWNVRSMFPKDNYMIVVDLSKTAGRHLFKFGSRISEARYSYWSAGDYLGRFDFSPAFTQRNPQQGDTTSGKSMASFLLGYPSGGGTDVNPQFAYKDRAFGFYIQDDFKVSRRLTLNMGLRWDIQTPLKERFNRMAIGFDPSTSYQLGGSTAKGGLIFADSDNRGWYDTNYRDFQPRLGIAYQVSPKMVWRSGYGLSFLSQNAFANGMDVEADGGGGGIRSAFSRRTPFVPSFGGGINSFVLNQPGASTFTNPYPAGILVPFGASLGPKTLVGQSISLRDHNFVVPRVHQFHFGFAYELPAKTTLEASYVGSWTHRTPVSRQLNYIPIADRQQGTLDPNYLNASVPNPFAGAPELTSVGLAGPTLSRAQALLPYPQFTGVTMSAISIGSTSYNSLEMRLNKRWNNGLMFLGVYTFSKTLLRNACREPQYTELYQVLAPWDRSQNLNMVAAYELPIGRGKALGHGWNSIVDRFFGNWQVNYHLAYMSGTPMIMPDATPIRDPQLPEGQQTYQRWFNTCTQLTSGARNGCASPDEPVTFLQLRPNELRTYSPYSPNIRLPFAALHDVSLFKNVPISERVRLELRAQAYNAFNTPIYGAPNTNITNPALGQVTISQVNRPREMELALKLIF